MGYFTLTLVYSDDIYYGGKSLFLNSSEDMQSALVGAHKFLLEMKPCDSPDLEDIDENDEDNATTEWSELQNVLAAIKRGEIHTFADLEVSSEHFRFEIIAHGDFSDVADSAISEYYLFTDEVQEKIEELLEDKIIEIDEEDGDDDRGYTSRLGECQKLLESYHDSKNDEQTFMRFFDEFMDFYREFHSYGIAGN